MKTFGLFLLAVVMVGVVGCGGGGGDDGVSLTGTWAGTHTDSVAGAGTIQVIISQSGSSVTGTWQSTFTGYSARTSGSLAGTVNGESLKTNFYPSDGSCAFTVTWIIEDNNRISGTYAAYLCVDSTDGTMEMMRQ